MLLVCKTDQSRGKMKKGRDEKRFAKEISVSAISLKNQNELNLLQKKEANWPLFR